MVGLTSGFTGAVFVAAFVASSNGAVSRESISLAGVVDVHCHSAPDTVPRALTDFELVRQSRAAGMRGLVLKNHYFSTAARAQIVMTELGGIAVFGGVVLNRSVGGINAEAVERMTHVEGRCGRFVWLPTFDAENQVRFSKEDRPFVSVVRNGSPVPELAAVFQIVAKHDLVLATGHSSADESLILVASARRAGVKRILVTHVFAESLRGTPEHFRRMADAGALLECTWMAHLAGVAGAINVGRPVPLKNAVDTIQTVGAKHFVISSDLGQRGNPPHPEGMRSFIEALLAEGVSPRAIDLMARVNPGRLVGLDPW